MSDSIVVVGGSGHMGSCAVGALLSEGHDVLVADRRPPSIEGARFAEGDASDQASIEALARGAGVIMNFAGPYYALGDAVARAALGLGIPYIDICDDAAATEDLLKLDGEARRSGIPLVLGAGYSPGVLNGLAMCAAAEFESVDVLTLAWVVGERGPMGPAPLQHFFYGITHDLPIWRDGAIETVPAFTAESAEEFPFSDPVGPFVVRDVGHPETLTVPRAVAAREVRSKGALMPRQATEIYDQMRRLGLLGDQIVRVGGVDVVARDFVTQLLTDRHNARADDGSRDVMALGVHASGTVGGRAVDRYVSTSANMTMAEATALPTVAAVPQLLAGSVPAGAHGPEALAVEDWFSKLALVAPHAFAEVEAWEGEGPRRTVPIDELGETEKLGEMFAN